MEITYWQGEWRTLAPETRGGTAGSLGGYAAAAAEFLNSPEGQAIISDVRSLITGAVKGLLKELGAIWDDLTMSDSEKLMVKKANLKERYTTMAGEWAKVMEDAMLKGNAVTAKAYAVTILGFLQSYGGFTSVTPGDPKGEDKPVSWWMEHNAYPFYELALGVLDSLQGASVAPKAKPAPIPFSPLSTASKTRLAIGKLKKQGMEAGRAGNWAALLSITGQMLDLAKAFWALPSGAEGLSPVSLKDLERYRSAVRRYEAWSKQAQNLAAQKAQATGQATVAAEGGGGGAALLLPVIPFLFG